jgi:hypothetical protein
MLSSALFFISYQTPVHHAHEIIDALVLGSLLVDIGLAVVSLFIELVGDGITGSLGAGAQVGIAVLGDVLVGLLGSGGTGARDGLGDVVDGIPGRVKSVMAVMMRGE